MVIKQIAGFKIHPIGIGTWAIGGWFKPNHDNDKDEIQAIRYSISLGQNHIDCAEMYADGHAEELVGRAIKGFDREKLFIASKVYKNHKNKKEVVKAVENILRRLNTNYLDLIYIHSPENVAPLEVYADALGKVIDKGMVKHFGVSKFDLKKLKHIQSVSKYVVVAIQNGYSVANKKYVDQKLKNYCRKNSVTIVAHSPLENCSRVRPVLELSEKYKKTPYQIALNWLISQENVVTIPKSTNENHIRQNIETANFELSNEDFSLLSDTF